MISDRIRRTLFWRLDSFKGKRIKKHYEDIKHKIEQQDNYLEISEVNKRELLSYAGINSSFYNKYKVFTLN